MSCAAASLSDEVAPTPSAHADFKLHTFSESDNEGKMTDEPHTNPAIWDSAQAQLDSQPVQRRFVLISQQLKRKPALLNQPMECADLQACPSELGQQALADGLQV